MKLAFIILSVISLLMVIAAIAIFIGKGDDFIVGYNLASNKTRDLYHTGRVRAIAGILLILVATALPATAILLIKGFTEPVRRTLPSALILLVVATFVAVHFWARKK